MVHISVLLSVCWLLLRFGESIYQKKKKQKRSKKGGNRYNLKHKTIAAGFKSSFSFTCEACQPFVTYDVLHSLCIR